MVSVGGVSSGGGDAGSVRGVRSVRGVMETVAFVGDLGNTASLQNSTNICIYSCTGYHNYLA